MNKVEVFQKPLWQCILLTIITFGIYGIYWLYKVCQSLSVINRSYNNEFLKYFLFSIITLGIYPIFFWYRMANDFNDYCEKHNVPSQIGPFIAGFIAAFFPIIDVVVFQFMINKIHFKTTELDDFKNEFGTTLPISLDLNDDTAEEK